MTLSLMKLSLIFKLAVGLPLVITINTNIPFDEQRSGSNHLTLGPSFEADTMSPPRYGEHILDQLFDDSPYEEVQSTDSLPSTAGEIRQNQEFGGQEMTVPSSSEPLELDSAEMEELSQIPSYRTALRTPLRFHCQPGNIQLPAYDAAARSNRQDQVD